MMDEELKVIRKLGVATSTEIGEQIEKNIRNVIKGLNNLEVWGEVKIMVFQQSFKRKTKMYLTDEIYNNLCKAQKSGR